MLDDEKSSYEPKKKWKSSFNEV